MMHIISEKVQDILDHQPMLMDIYHNENVLGEGFNAMVLAIDDDWVIRASMTEKDGWRAITRVSPMTRERLSLPVVLKTWKDTESLNGQCLELSVVERLEELEFGVDFNFESMTLECLNTPWKTPDVDKHISPTEPCYNVIKQAVRAWRVLRRMRVLNAASLDLNYSNIMKRKDGTYVLSDPFGGLQLTGEEKCTN